MTRTPTATSPTTLIYDGDCGLCLATAAWLSRRIAPRDLRPVALSQAPSDAAVGAIVRGLELSAILHVVTPDGRVVTGARAVLAVGRLAPRWQLLAMVFDHRVGHLLLGPMYRQIARHRHQIGRALRLPATCPMPTAPERPR